jgi:hypothetical protein
MPVDHLGRPDLDLLDSQAVFLVLDGGLGDAREHAAQGVVRDANLHDLLHGNIKLHSLSPLTRFETAVMGTDPRLWQKSNFSQGTGKVTRDGTTLRQGPGRRGPPGVRGRPGGCGGPRGCYRAGDGGCCRAQLPRLPTIRRDTTHAPAGQTAGSVALVLGVSLAPASSCRVRSQDLVSPAASAPATPGPRPQRLALDQGDAGGPAAGEDPNRGRPGWRIGGPRARWAGTRRRAAPPGPCLAPLVEGLVRQPHMALLSLGGPASKTLIEAYAQAERWPGPVGICRASSRCRGPNRQPLSGSFVRTRDGGSELRSLAVAGGGPERQIPRALPLTGSGTSPASVRIGSVTRATTG